MVEWKVLNIDIVDSSSRYYINQENKYKKNKKASTTFAIYPKYG